jgi:tetratricopeptide (TPR) repeat protein
MDKSEYNLKIEELKTAMHAHDFEKAVDVADSLDIKKIRDNNLLSLIADAYELTGDNEQAKKILLMAYENTNTGRQLAYRLCLISIKLKELDEANEFYQDFIEMAPRDSARFILKYKMAKAKKKPVEELIKILEDYVNIDMEEKWAYELAKLYDIAGEGEKCVNMCDEISLWFAEGKYVVKAMDLKKKYESLTSTQQDNYNKKSENKSKEQEEKKASTQELMDKIMEKTSIKSRIDEAVKEANERKAESKTIEEVTGTEKNIDKIKVVGKEAADTESFDFPEINESAVEEIKPYDDIEGATIDVNSMTHPQEVEEIKIPGISDDLNELESDSSDKAEAEKEDVVAKTDKEKKRLKLRPFSVKPKKTENPLKEDKKVEAPVNAKVTLEEDKDFKLINPDDVSKVEEPVIDDLGEDTTETVDMEFNEDMDMVMKSDEEKEDILNVDDVEDILHQLQARGILKAETVNSAVSIIENVRETKKESKEEKPDEKEVSTLDRWQEDNVEVEKPLEKEQTSVEDNTSDNEKKEQTSVEDNTSDNEENKASQVEIPDLEEIPDEVEDLPEEPEKEEVETTENQDASELEVIESQEEEPEVDIEKIAESIPDIEEIQLAEEAQPEEIPSEQEVAENVQKEASETAEDLGKTAIFTIPKADIETGNNTGEVVVDEELPNIDEPEIDLETGIPEPDLGKDTKNAEESTENENAESVDAEKSESTENEEAVQEEPAQDNSINLDIHSTKDLSAKVEVISGTDWEQPEYEEKLEEEEEQLEVAKEEAEEGTPERTSEGELLNRILNKNNEEIPEPELVATEEELSVFKNFFNVEGLEDNIQEVVKELIAGYTPNGKSTDGNVVILGEEKTGKTSLAVEIIKLVNKKRGRRNRRLAKIDATALNKRGFRNSLNKLLGSDLIVENAEKLGAMILSEVVDVSGMFTDDMLIILEGETEPMEKMLKDSPRLSKVFNHVIRIKQYDIKEWVEYGKRYAKDKGYVMEELASLAFYKAIDDYFGEHKGIGRADVEKIVDTAIANSHKLGRKLSGLFSSNKNDDGLYILIESDFIF